MATFTESFETERRKHEGATKPKLPVWASHIDDPHVAVRMIYAEGYVSPIATRVPVELADFIEDAINLHDELVEALKTLSNYVGVDLAEETEAAVQKALVVLAKARHEK